MGPVCTLFSIRTATFVPSVQLEECQCINKAAFPESLFNKLFPQEPHSDISPMILRLVNMIRELATQ